MQHMARSPSSSRSRSSLQPHRSPPSQRVTESTLPVPQRVSPHQVAIWILGKNYATVNTTSVNSDASFKYEVKQEVHQEPCQRPVLRRRPAPDAEQHLRCLPRHQYRNSTYGYVVNKKLVSQYGRTTPTDNLPAPRRRQPAGIRCSRSTCTGHQRR